MHPETPAPVWKRLFAMSYDGLILTGLWLTSGFILILITSGAPPTGLTQAVLCLITLGYFIVSWVKGGQTLGLRAWRLQVVEEHQAKVTWKSAITRTAAGLVTLAPIGVTLVTAFLNPERKTLYDRWSHTQVISKAPIQR